MHGKAHLHSSRFGLNWSPANVALAILLALLFLIFLFLFLSLTAQPALGQNSVPPTAVQAAKMPQYAWRLAHPAKRVPPPKSQVFARAAKHLRPLDSSDIYDNGPIDGNTDAWTINFGFIVSDSFTLASDQTTITGMSFGAWLNPGDTLTSVEVSITSGENSGTSYFDQTVYFTQGTCTVNQYGYNICSETGSFSAPTLNAGTYWVNLQNASVPSGDPVYWDENSGPSLASQNDVGSIPSESFTILGNATTTSSTTFYTDFACPSPQPGFHDLHDFSSNAGPSGLAIDTTGKLYGTFSKGGSHGAGLLYDFAQKAGHWFLTSLYSFTGASNGSGPNGVIVGPQGKLYGAANGGLTNCGGYYCGLIYESEPPANVCATALCSWNETTIYEFTGPPDAAGGSVTTFDSAGNLYGIGYGGAYGQGAVFELSPSQGGWTEEKILYSFTGGADGGGPNSLVLGQDGNLYGTASWGGIYNENCYGYGAYCGVVFQLTPSGSGWTENVIYAFTGGSDGWGPYGLIQNSYGGLNGISTCEGYTWTGCLQYTPETVGVIFGLYNPGNGWNFGIAFDGRYEACENGPSGDVGVHSLATDRAGNLYATWGGAHYSYCGDNCYQEFVCGAIINVGGYPTTLAVGYADIFYNLTTDADGNLYGTTSTCGFGTLQRDTGMIWQYSP